VSVAREEWKKLALAQQSVSSCPPMSSSANSSMSAPANPSMSFVDEQEIEEGLTIVERQLADRTVRTGEEELFKARARDKGSIKLIDIVRTRLDARNDCFVAELPSLGLKDVCIGDELVKKP
jgi:hypothetical protein